MKSDRRPSVTIVGGGFSGTMLAAQLARRGVTSTLVEKAGRAGQGTAYSTRDEAHVLNVRDSSMSAWPDALTDFSDWLVKRGLPTGGFAQRRRFGEYLSTILAEAKASGLVELIEGEAVSARREGDGWVVGLSDGRTLASPALALAQGNQPPEPFPLKGADDRLIDDPWSDEGRARVEDAARAQLPVLVIGTGLTMVDMVLTLETAGHAAPLTAVSRRGLIPRAHVDKPASALDGSGAPSGLMAGWRWIRQRARSGDDWRARIDSLRPETHRLWQAMERVEQKRFLRHARPWWDVHRHRIAPEVAAMIDARAARGQLEIMAGRIAGLDGPDVLISKRGDGVVRREAALVLNCTGPLGRIEKTRDPMLRQMLDDGLIERDWLGIGLAADRTDRAGDRLWVMGPLSKALWWEIIAVPDIRGQAERVAEEMRRVLIR